MKKLNLNLAFVLLLVAGGCGQIIGLGDYEIDPKLDSNAGKAGSRNNEAGEGGVGNGGSTNGGSTNGGSTNGGGKGGSEGGTTPVVNPSAGEAGQPPSDGGNGGTGPGAVIPCDSVTCCTTKGGRAVGEELLVIPVPSACDPLTEYCDAYYGGFEYGTQEAGNSPWIESSAQEYPLVTDGELEGSEPHKGSYLAFLGGVHDEQSLLVSQPLDIPSDAGWLTLSGYRIFEADRADMSDPDNLDRMSLSLWDENELLELPIYWDHTDPGITDTWTKFESSFDAKPHQGETRYLYALGETDGWSDADLGSGGAGGAGPGAGWPGGTNYIVDDLSLKVFRCYQR